MIRMKSLFAALVITAIVAVVPAANAQTVHFIGAGSSAMFQGFAVASFNDVGPDAVAALPSGHIGTIHHWSTKTLAHLVDARDPAITTQNGSAWVVWVSDDTAGTSTDVWAYISVDSTVGVRAIMAAPRAKFLLDAGSVGAAGAGAISSALFTGGAPDSATGIPADVYAALGGASGTPITAGMSDIRPEDALLATRRIIGAGPNPPNGGADSVPTTTNNFIYSFTLNYGVGSLLSNGYPTVGADIQSGIAGSTAKAQPVQFALPGFNDPITGTPVSSTLKVFPVGEAPVIFVVNRSNTVDGLGQVLAGGDHSYYVRNVWDQHPWPMVANRFPDLTPDNPACVGSTTGACHYTRRPVGNLFSGGDCETDNSSFTWPLSNLTEGLRVVPPSGTVKPITVFLREPLSGTYNTIEYTVFRRYGTPGGSNAGSPGAPFERPAYISQESNVGPYDAATFPKLNKQCPSKYRGPSDPFDTTTGLSGAPSNEGTRVRGIGTGEVVGSSGSGGVFNTPDSIAYTFFSFGNVSKLATSANFGYLMVDGIDPIFQDYSNTVGNPGQPALPGSPLTWGQLPKCTPGGGGGVPDCTVLGIWGGNPSYPHVRDGSYPAWSELRMICDTTEASCSTDPFGGQKLISNLQADVHFSHLGGVPDLLPFSNATSGVLSFNPPYGDAGFVRQHFLAYEPNDNSLAGKVAPWGSAGSSNAPTSNHMGGNQHSGSAQAFIDFSKQVCSVGHVAPGTPANGPTPADECGGDVGGFVVPVANSGLAPTGNLQ